MVFLVEVASSYVIPLYCNKPEQLLDKLFCFKKTLFMSSTSKFGERNEWKITFSNISFSSNVKECLNDGEMYKETISKPWFIIFVALRIA